MWNFHFDCVAYSNSNNQRFNVMFDVRSKAVFFCFHTHFSSYQSSSSFHPRYIKSVEFIFRVLLLTYCHDFPSLSFYLIKFAIFPFDNTCTKSRPRNVFIAMTLFLPLSLPFMINFVLLKYYL